MLNDTIRLMGKRVERRNRQIEKLEEINSQVKKLNKSMECVVIANMKRDYPELVEEYKQGCMTYRELLEVYQKLEEGKIFLYNDKESGC